MKVAYIGEWHPTNGTYYRQRITCTKDEYEMLNRKMVERYSEVRKEVNDNHIMTSSQANFLAYCKPLESSDRVDQKIYLKLNQLYSIAAAIYGMPEHKNTHRRITDNNTILVIK